MGVIKINAMRDDWYKDEDTVRRHYNVVSKRYADYWKQTTPLSYLFNSRKQLVLELLQDVPTGDILDIGCGPGVMVKALTEKGYNYHGIDISEGNIKECQSKFSADLHSIFAVGRGQNIPFQSEKFSAVLCLGALEYVVDVEQVLKEMRRVLKPDGVIIFSMQNSRSPYRISERIFKNWAEPCRQFTERFADRQLSNCRLHKIQCIYYDFNLLPRPLDRLHPRISLLLNKRFGFLRYSPLRWLGTGFIIKCG